MSTVEFLPAEGYLAAMADLLGRDEARHNLALGIAMRAVAEPSVVGPDDWFAVVRDPLGKVDFGAWHTASHPVGISGGSAEGHAALCAELCERSLPVPGAVGIVPAVDVFAKAVAAATGQTPRTQMEQALYRLDAVQPLDLPPGEFRRAVDADEEIVRLWSHGFDIDCGLRPEGSPPRKEVLAFQRGDVWLWCEGGAPVSMAATSRPTQSGVTIAGVYTPREARGHGYATAVVAKLSAQCLDEGKSFCCLFTDLANPTSNEIYQRIGYQRLDDFRMVTFERPGASRRP